jgi:hypothetical protein
MYSGNQDMEETVESPPETSGAADTPVTTNSFQRSRGALHQTR